MYVTTKGLVVRVCPYNDTDAMLTILTGEYGKVSAKVRALRRKNSPLAAPCQLLAYSEFTLFEYKDSFTVNEATSIELFTGLRSDLQKLSLGSYFAQVAEVISQEDLPSPSLLSLVLNCLYGLAKLNVSEAKAKAVFEMRTACLAGYTPDISCCHICGDPEPSYFDITEGLTVCATCQSGRTSGIRMPLTAGILDAMRYICYCQDKKIFGFDLPSDSMERLSQITEVYLTTQLERGFSALDFYKTLVFQADPPYLGE